MKRIVHAILAAGTAALALHATPARADEYREHRAAPIDAGRYPPPPPARVEPQRADYRDRRAWDWRVRQRRDLEREREAFYARWNGNRRARARFEREYARRCSELERHGWRG
jgi:hypothetical protein